MCRLTHLINHVSLHAFYLEMENEEKLSEDASEKDIREADSKGNSDDDLDSFQVVDSWEDKDSDTERSREKRAVVQKSSKSVDNEEEVPAKRPKLVEVDEDSDDDFAAQLLEGQDSNSL